MHEGRFTEDIVKAVLEGLAPYPGARLERVSVRVGDVYHLEPESVRLHFELATRGTRLEGTVLDLVEVPLAVRCRSCGSQGGVEDHHLPACRSCGSQEVTVLEGDRIEIQPLEAVVGGA
jgi:hydrogenase nickel incorporation protein HypA/HybF